MDTSFYKNQAELALNDMLRWMAFDTNASNTDSMIFYLEDWNSVHQFNPTVKNSLVNLYWEKEDYTVANQYINELNANAETQSLGVVLQKIGNELSTGGSVTNLISDTLLLDSLANDTSNLACGLARNLMGVITGKFYPVGIESIPASSSRGESISSSTFEPETKTDKKEETLKIFPNPNSGSFNIVWDIKRVEVQNLNYQIVNLSGHIVQRGLLNGNEGQMRIELIEPKGVYLLQILSQGLVLEQKNVIIGE